MHLERAALAGGARRLLAPMLGCSALGVVVGLLWVVLVPRVRYLVTADGLAIDPRTSQGSVAADGWLALLCVAAGLLATLLAYVVTRRRGGHPDGWLLAGLVVGGAAGSLLAWRLGVALAPDDLDVLAAGRRPGASFPGGLRLRAGGVLALWPVTSVALFFALLVGFERPHPHADRGEDAPTVAAPDADVSPDERPGPSSPG